MGYYQDLKKEFVITVSTQYAQVYLWPPHTVSQHQSTLHSYGNGQFLRELWNPVKLVVSSGTQRLSLVNGPIFQVRPNFRKRSNRLPNQLSNKGDSSGGALGRIAPKLSTPASLSSCLSQYIRILGCISRMGSQGH